MASVFYYMSDENGFKVKQILLYPSGPPVKWIQLL